MKKQSLIEKLALKCGAAKFYPEAQLVREDNYLVGKQFLEKFRDEIINECIATMNKVKIHNDLDDWDLSLSFAELHIKNHFYNNVEDTGEFDDCSISEDLGST